MRQQTRRSTLVAFGMIAAAAATAAKAAWLRSRARALAVLVDRDEESPAAGSTRVPPSDGFVVVTAAGVHVDAATAAAAIAHASGHDLDVVDLVPGDLPVGTLTALLLQIDPATYCHDRLAVGRGAGHACVVRSGVLDRIAWAEATDTDPGGARWRELDPVAYLELSRRLKRYAPTSTDLVVAPRMCAVDPDPAWRMPSLHALAGVAAPALAPLPAVAALLAGLAPLVHPVAGTAALVAYMAEPRIVGWGGPVRSRDVAVSDLLARPARALASVVRPFAQPAPAPVRRHRARLAEADRQRRAGYDADAARLAAFFEPRRTECPWCGESDLDRAVQVPDLFQGKPGTFVLDECGGCGHIFQNPRLTLDGLDHYYRDFYDGRQREHTELMFSFAGRSYRDRAAMLDGVAEPKRWLDVGTGHGYFCLVAQEMWPDTRFDGLDLTPNVIEAQHRGWVEHGYHGLFPDLAAELTGGYDVVSMHHYLEHTRDPAVELDAAATVLEAGGHLLIEVPAPESLLGRHLGWLWGPWLQPQHQHFVPLANLVAALGDRGFTVLAVERGSVHQPVDLSYAVMLLAKRLAPAGGAPWDPPDTAARRLGRTVVYGGLLPAAGVAVALDRALLPAVHRWPVLSNAYRVLARKA
ncbi:MAG: class I SAM-dependent methyltransferase [Acidimicrobiales bacterium]|nr:class I SAM-dependent methyltransferase [Acidimicrobiales bacterium]